MILCRTCSKDTFSYAFYLVACCFRFEKEAGQPGCNLPMRDFQKSPLNAEEEIDESALDDCLDRFQEENTTEEETSSNEAPLYEVVPAARNTINPLYEEAAEL